MTKRTNREHVIAEAKSIGRDFVGVDEWKRSKIGYLTGFTAFTKAGERAFRPAIVFGGFLGKLAKETFSRERVVKLPTDSADPYERFWVARHVYGTDDISLRAQCRATHNVAMTSFLMFLASLIYGIVFFSELQGTLPSLMGNLFPFVPVFPALAYFLRASFWNYQIRHEALHSFGHFLRSGELLAISAKLNSDREAA